MWLAIKAFFSAIFDALRQRQRDKERDELVQETTQDDARIADQAAAASVFERAGGVPVSVSPDNRKGRRPSAAATKRQG
jgi:hypothetical protein